MSIWQRVKRTQRGKKVIVALWREDICSYLSEETLGIFSRGLIPPEPITAKSKPSTRVNCPIICRDNGSSWVNYTITVNTCSSCVNFFNHKGRQLLFPGSISQWKAGALPLLETECQWDLKIQDCVSCSQLISQSISTDWDNWLVGTGDIYHQ